MPVRVTASDVRRARELGGSTTVGMPEPHLALLTDYVGLTDVALRRRSEPERGLYIAESE